MAVLGRVLLPVLRMFLSIDRPTSVSFVFPPLLPSPALLAASRSAPSDRKGSAHSRETEDCRSAQRNVPLPSPAPCRQKSVDKLRCASPTQQSKPAFRVA